MMDINQTSNTAKSSLKPAQIRWPIYVFILVILLALLWFLGGKNFLMNREMSDGYQAVFLDNGQVYFGKLKYVSGGMKLSSVYYLQVTDSLQPAGDSANNVVAKKEQNIQLIKLGSELHGPEDAMFLDRANILFWENMKDDSQVIEAIKKFKGGAF